MKRESLGKPISPQMQPSSSCQVRYLQIGVEDLNFCISDIYEADLEPPSHPIVEVHVHNLLEVGYCHRGAGVLLVEDRVLPFNRGDVCFVNNQEMHMSRAVGDSPCHWSYFWLDPARLLAGIPEGLDIPRMEQLGGAGFPNIITPRQNATLCRTVREIVEEIQHPSFNHRLVLRGLVCVMMGMLHRVLAGSASGESPLVERKGIERIAPALSYMTQSYKEPISVETLAELCDMSMTHFRRIFLGAVGVPPLKYLAQLRVRMAAAMLCGSEKNVTQVAYEVGFESINTFNRHFHATTGMAPLEWRKRHGQR